MVEKMAVDSSPGHRSSHSVETHRTRRSHRSRSRSNERNGTRREKDKERERDKDKDRRRKSRSSGRSERDKERDRDRDRDRDRERRERRSRSRDRHIRERNRERRRERDRDREDRDRERNGHHRDGERERRDRDRPERRRRREDDDDDYRAKRLREDDDNLVVTPVNGTSREDGHGRRPRSRDSDRRSVRSVKGDDRPPRRERERERDGKRDDHRGSRVSSPLEEDPQPVSPSRRASPSYDTFEEPREEDSEARSVFVSQLAARMTARDLGYFLEDKLGENSVMDSRIVTDRLSRRSKGIAYVEFRTIELVERAIALTGTIVMGLPIMIQHTEAERNKTHAGDGSINLPPGPSSHGATLYVGSLHFNLTDSDIRQVFEPFGELDFVDLHRDPATGRSKGYAFIHYKRAEDAKMALEQMEGFELAGRTLRVNTVHDKGQTRIMTQDSLDESGGGNLNAASRQALMHKLARIDTPPVAEKPVSRPTITQTMTSRSVLLRNAFDPTEETEKDWDKDLGEDVKGECQSKYGNVQYVKVEKDSEGEIYVQFESVETAKAAVEGLNGRWFGGKKLSATFISDAIMQAHR